MREVFSDKNFRRSKILIFAKGLLIFSLLVFFLPLIILPFFNHAVTDDYFCGYNLNDKGFWHYQSFIYAQWGGRFAATFTGALFAGNNFLYSHYYLHTLSLLLLNFLSLYFLTSAVSKYILKQSLSAGQKIIYSLLILALEICSVPQASTFLFWFSSAITYHLPLILIQTQIALCIMLYKKDDNASAIFLMIILPLLVFITIGFNELFIVVQFFFIAIMFCIKVNKKLPVLFWVAIIIAFVLSTFLLIVSPGNQQRMHGIDPKSIATGLTAILYHCSETLWYIFKNPLFWITGISVFILGNKMEIDVHIKSFVTNSIYIKWLLPVFCIIFLVASVSVPVLALKGGIIPDRYLNPLACFLIMLFLLCFFIAGANNILKIPAYNIVTGKILLCILFSIGLLSNGYIADAYKSVVIAPVYDHILTEREESLKKASADNKKALVKDYDASIQELLQTKYYNSSVTLQQLISEKPPLLFIEDDLASEHSIDILKRYYHLDSLDVSKSPAH